MTPLENRLVLHRLICREFGYDEICAMLDRLHDVPANLNIRGESEYAYASYLSCTAPIRAEELVEYDASGDHTLNALKQPNESCAAKTGELIFREFMLKVED